MNKSSLFLAFALYLFISPKVTFAQSPGLMGVTPSTGYEYQTLDVILSGQNTQFNSGSTTFYFHQGTSTFIFPSSVDIVSDTTAVGTFFLPGGTPYGYYDVTTSGSPNMLTLTDGFYVSSNPDPPLIVEVNPDTMYQGQILPMTLSGYKTNFSQGSGTVAVRFIQGTSTVFQDDATIAVDDSTLDGFLVVPIFVDTGYCDVQADDPILGTLEKEDGCYIIPLDSGNITGWILQGNQRTAGPGDPLVGQSLLLKNKFTHDILSQDVSDSLGYFEFLDVMWGDYYVFVDEVGFPNTNPPQMTIGPDNLSSEDHILMKNDEGIDHVTSISSPSENFLGLKVFPNPVLDVLNIKIDGVITGQVEFELFNVLGQRVYHSPASDLSSKDQVHLVDSRLRDGLYILRMKMGNMVTEEKVIIRRAGN